MTRRVALGAAALALALGAGPSAVEVTYLGNAGFLVTAGERRVVIDGLHGNGLEHYVALPGPHREKLEAASEPFTGIDLILATHDHADHFDAGAVARFLGREPGAVFVSTGQAAERVGAALGDDAGARARVRTVAPAQGQRAALEFPGLKVEVLNLHHGRGVGVDNFGFLVEIGGVRLLHVGDTAVTAEEIAPLGLPDAGIEVAFVPYWHLLDDEGRAMVRHGIGARSVIAMHVPEADAPPDYFGDSGTLESMVRAIEAQFPGAVAFREPMDRRSLPQGNPGTNTSRGCRTR